MRRVFQAIWAILIWLFALMIPIQFYLAGHAAMESAYSAYKPAPLMKTAWDPHAAVGSIMGIIMILALLAVLAARPPRPLPWLTAGLFAAMLIQSVLPFLDDSVSTRWIAALHGVNALVVTGLAFNLAVRARAYLPFSLGRRRTVERGEVAGSRAG